MNQEAQELINNLELQAHPEGGYFKETYRSSALISKDNLDSIFEGDRNLCTCIYFLLTSEAFSAFHRINQDEIWHFYKGALVQLHLISPDGNYKVVTLGNNVINGEVPQFVVPGGYYFGAHLIQPDSYALFGCTVSPGFDFSDFQLPERSELLKLFPQHSKIITLLTR